MNKKICSKCRKEKPTSEFNKSKNHKDGLAYRCKQCISEYRAQYYADNPGKKREYDLRYRKKNREKLLEYYREYARKKRSKKAIHEDT